MSPTIASRIRSRLVPCMLLRIKQSAWAVLAAALLFDHAASGLELASLNSARASITSDELRDHVYVLADDILEGREAGSRGGYAAAKYLVRHFQQHLEPAGDQRDYFQLFSAHYRNILGVRPGADDELRQEYLLVGAHYDHVGYGSRQTSRGPIGYVHNGADDNASGIAALLEVVDALGRSNLSTKRSILFAFWDGEEKGLLGSEHWAQHATVPLSQIKIAINVDMIGHLDNDHLEVIGSRSMPGLRSLVAQANYGNEVSMTFPWSVASNSDHHTFFSRNIPILMFHTGLHENYHRPSDDAETIDVKGLGRVARLILDTVAVLANEPQLGPYRVAARHENDQAYAANRRPLPPTPPRLGISWRPPQESGSEPGLIIDSVVAGSSAEASGLQTGDRLVAQDGQPLLSSSTLQQAVVAAEKLTLTIVKKDTAEPLDVAVTLRGKPSRIGFSWRHDAAEPRTVTIVRVVPHSLADQAGIRVGDRITQLDGQQIRDSKQLIDLSKSLEFPAAILIERNGQLLERTLGSGGEHGLSATDT